MTWIEFDHFLEKYKQFEYESRIAESELKKLDCYLHMHHYELGHVCAMKCEKLFKTQSANWFIYKECYVLLAFHTEKYDQVRQTIESVILHDNFKYQTINRQEKWKIFDAYLYILTKSGIVNISNVKKQQHFHLAKFLNETTIYSKDKSGYNISIVIIQIIHLLLEKEFSNLIGRIDALERYINRYIGKEAVKRSKLFLKMILKVEHYEFNLEAIKKNTISEFATLQTFPYKYDSNLEGMEIIPYTTLWQIVLKCLS